MSKQLEGKDVLSVGLTPNEILNKEFNKRLRGYDIDEVSDYLDLIAVDFERLLKDNRELTQRLADTQEKLRYFEQLQETLNSSIMVANEAAERLKQNARKEAELILFETEREADRIVLQANQQVQQTMQEQETLRRTSRQFYDTLRHMLTQQLELISEKTFVESLGANESAPVTMERPNMHRQAEHVQQLLDELETGSMTDLPEHVAIPTIEQYEAELAPVESTVFSTESYELPQESAEVALDVEADDFLTEPVLEPAETEDFLAESVLESAETEDFLAEPVFESTESISPFKQEPGLAEVEINSDFTTEEIAVDPLDDRYIPASEAMDDFDFGGSPAPKSSAENQPMESLLGQTIRIDLPK
ncbi:MAG: DivIVA domain-containing protein [Aerococcaceae bacterium]|nr:DivIVA domain-containing protein [Aerococcaceae bacterium]